MTHAGHERWISGHSPRKSQRTNQWASGPNGSAGYKSNK